MSRTQASSSCAPQPQLRFAAAGSQTPHIVRALERLTDVATYRAWIREHGMRHRSATVDDFGLDPVFSERWHLLFQLLYRSYWRVSTTGIDNVPERGRAIIVANRSGLLPYDALMLMYAIRYDHPAHRTVRPLIEDVLYHLPFVGPTLVRLGCVRACQDNAQRLLRNEQLVVVFPEGAKGSRKLYKDRYRLQRFGRGGLVRLALRTRSTIIPTAVTGAEETYPILARLSLGGETLGLPSIPITPTFPWLGAFGAIPLPKQWTVTFGNPVDLAEHGADAESDSVLVNRLTEDVRSRVQSMINEALADGRRTA